MLNLTKIGQRKMQCKHTYIHKIECFQTTFPYSYQYKTKYIIIKIYSGSESRVLWSRGVSWERRGNVLMSFFD